jgi:hypothetical protein
VDPQPRQLVFCRCGASSSSAPVGSMKKLWLTYAGPSTSSSAVPSAGRSAASASVPGGDAGDGALSGVRQHGPEQTDYPGCLVRADIDCTTHSLLDRAISTPTWTWIALLACTQALRSAG